MNPLLSAWARYLGRPNADQSRRARQKAAQPTVKPRLEILEERCLLSYSIIDLGTLGGGFSFASGPNNSGQVAGTAETPSGSQHAYLWDSSQGMQDLGTLGGSYSFADGGINNYGQIAGQSYTASGSEHAFVWNTTQGMQDLGTLGGNNSGALAINDAGQVVGGADSAGGLNHVHAFVWDSIRGMQDLGTLGGNNSGASLINNSGQVAGQSDTASGTRHAFIWDSIHGMQDLGTLGGDRTEGPPASVPQAINGLGQVVGLAETASGADHAFLWDSVHGMQDLGTLGGDRSEALAINNTGQVAGSAQTASGQFHAFVWDSIHGMQDLGTLGGTFSEADAINDSGQVVGSAQTASGQFHAFVWDSSHGMQDLLGTVGGTLSHAEGINGSGQVVGFANFAGTGIHAFLASPAANSPVFGALSAPTITYGTATTTLSGHLADGSLTPPAGELVTVTSNGITQNAVLDGSGNFRTTFSTGSFHSGSTSAVSYRYLGDSTFGFASGSASLIVQPAPLIITADNQTKVYGAALATLTVSYSGFVNGDTPASLSTPPALSTNATAASPAGSYAITAAGAFDPDYAISYAGGTMTIGRAGTATTVTSSLSSLMAGQPVTFTATVSAIAPGAGTPTGWVDFVDNASNTHLGTAPLSGGSASLTVSSLLEDSSLPGGIPHSIVGTYHADNNFFTSDNSLTPVNIVVTDVPPTVAITSVLPIDVSSNPTAPVGTLLTFGGSFSDSPAENRVLNSSDMVSWGLMLNGQPYSLPAATVTNAPTFSFIPTAVGTYVVSMTVADPDGGSASIQQTVDIASMDANSLQNVINAQANYANPFFNFYGSPPAPVALTIQADPTQENAAVAALNSLVQAWIFDYSYDVNEPVNVTVTLNLTSGNFSDLKFSLQPPVSDSDTGGLAYVTLIVNGVNGSTTVIGNSPALTITSGNVTVNNVTFTTATNSPTIFVSGGSLALRNDVVQESTGFVDAAISVTGDSVDLGSTASPGSNMLNVNGSGQLVQASGPGLVSTAGDTFQTNGTMVYPLTSTTLASSANPTFFNQSVTLTATVAALAPNTGTPTGAVSFFDQTSGTTLATVTLSSGVGKWTSSSLTPGGHNILAVYSGDTKFITSSSGLFENVSSFSGFLAPLSNNLAFNMNRVIPIKWQLGDSSGKAVTGLSAVASLQVAPVQSGGVIGTPFNPTPSNGIGLRNDGKQYIFNWDTKGVAVGTYQIQLTLADGTVQTKTLQIVTKGGYAALLVDGTGGTATMGGLLAGDIELYVDNSNGDLTTDQLDRIQDAVTAVDAVTEPYGVAVREVTDSTQADVTLNMDTTSAVGGYADGVLGCTTDAGQITIIQGWDFYAGSDAAQMGAGQYDFQTVVTHELGHALGLGHTSDSTSVMYAMLDTGTVHRSLATADLNVPDSDTNGSCGLHAALFSTLGADASVGAGSSAASNERQQVSVPGRQPFPASLANPISEVGSAGVRVKGPRVGGEDAYLLWSPRADIAAAVSPGYGSSEGIENLLNLACPFAGEPAGLFGAAVARLASATPDDAVAPDQNPSWPPDSAMRAAPAADPALIEQAIDVVLATGDTVEQPLPVTGMPSAAAVETVFATDGAADWPLV
jgi:probable HAF family extracellular repeat protein